MRTPRLIRPDLNRINEALALLQCDVADQEPNEDQEPADWRARQQQVDGLVRTRAKVQARLRPS